jgi:hypothetical protein
VPLGDLQEPVDEVNPERALTRADYAHDYAAVFPVLNEVQVDIANPYKSQGKRSFSNIFGSLKGCNLGDPAVLALAMKKYRDIINGQNVQDATGILDCVSYEHDEKELFHQFSLNSLYNSICNDNFSVTIDDITKSLQYCEWCTSRNKQGKINKGCYEKGIFRCVKENIGTMVKVATQVQKDPGNVLFLDLEGLLNKWDSTNVLLDDDWPR